jgi:hypothetical protein
MKKRSEFSAKRTQIKSPKNCQTPFDEKLRNPAIKKGAMTLGIPKFSK